VKVIERSPRALRETEGGGSFSRAGESRIAWRIRSMRISERAGD
jgi:hypothetical protein